MNRTASPTRLNVVRTGLACLIGASQIAGGTAFAAEAKAEGASESELMTGDIVVTAQRREERLINAPVVVSAVSGSTLTQLGVREATQLNNVVPSLEIADPGTIPKVAIRGVSLNDFGYANESPIAFYTNDVYFGTPLSPLGQIFDINRVEVLRGPQGTLFGRNATGGLIQIITAKPTKDFSGSVSFQYGSFDQVIVEGHQNIPLSDTVRTRTAAIFNRDKGWQKSVINGARFAKTHAWSIRETIDIDLSESITNSLLAHYGKKDGQNSVVAFRGTQDPTTGALCSIENVLANLCVTSTGLRNPNPNPRQVYSSQTERPNILETWGVDNTLKYSATTFNLTSVTAYESTKAFSAGDVGGLPNSLLIDAYFAKRKQFSQELRADGEFGQFKWVAGAYYFHENLPYGLVTSPGLVPLVGTIFFGQVLQNEFKQKTKSIATFGQVDYDVLPSLTLTGGIRYSHEKKTLTITDTLSNPNPVFPPETYSPTSNVVTWKAGAKWQVQKGLMVYANVATGFKTAAFNTSLVSPTGAAPARPEKNTNYELGIKGETPDRRLQASIVAFYTDYREMQTITFRPGTFTATLFNIPKARIHGLEAEVTARPFDGLSLDGSISILDTKVIAPGVAVAGVPINGMHLSLSPKFSAKGGIRYDYDTGSMGTISPWVHVSYRTKTWAALPTSLADEFPGYTLMDVGITWASPDKKWAVDLLAQNATDKAYYTNNGLLNLGPALGAIDFVRFGEPRRYSARLTVKW